MRGERIAALRMIVVYDQISSRLLKQIHALNDQIDEARSKGETISPSWLSRQNRYKDLLSQTDREMRRFSKIANNTITDQQQQAAKAGLHDSIKLMESAAGEAKITATFNRLPVAAVENLAGFLGDGSPLKDLLNQL